MREGGGRMAEKLTQEGRLVDRSSVKRLEIKYSIGWVGHARRNGLYMGSRLRRLGR